MVDLGNQVGEDVIAAVRELPNVIRVRAIL